MEAGAAGADKEKMATEKQIAANRRNALKSTGPKTEAGRQIVSRNAITHGLTGAQALVLPEEADEYFRFGEAVFAQWNLEGAVERFHCERMVQAAWRLRRIQRIETSVLMEMCQRQRESAAGVEPTIGRAYAEAIPVLTQLSRYERQMERSLQEAQKELETLQYARTMGCSPMYARKVRTFPSPGKNRTEHEGRYR